MDEKHARGAVLASPPVTSKSRACVRVCVCACVRVCVFISRISPKLETTAVDDVTIKDLNLFERKSGRPTKKIVLKELEALENERGKTP